MASAGFGGRVEGVHAVKAALDAGRLEVLYVERTRRDAESLAAAALRSGAEVKLVDDIRLLAKTESPQGLAAKARQIPFVSLDSLLERGPDGEDPALLVLDHLEDPRNVGAVARSALAAGMTGLAAPRRRAAPFSALAFKAAAGALEHLPVAAVSSVADTARRASAAGVWTVGLDSGASRTLFGLDLLAGPAALFVGAESRGLGRLVRQRLDLLASIPMAAGAASLNASAAAAVACFELRRVREASS